LFNSGSYNLLSGYFLIKMKDIVEKFTTLKTKYKVGEKTKYINCPFNEEGSEITITNVNSDNTYDIEYLNTPVEDFEEFKSKQVTNKGKAARSKDYIDALEALDDRGNFKIPSNKAGLITAWDNITISMYTTRKNISIDDLYIEEESCTIWSKQVESRGELSTYNNHNLCELFFSDGISIFRKGWEKLLGYIDSTIPISDEEIQSNLTFVRIL